jgi:hypothetical protein
MLARRAMSDPQSPPETPQEPLPPRPTRGQWMSRLIIAHLLSIPLAIGCAMAAMPPTFHLFGDALIRMEDEAIGMFVVTKTAYPAAVAFVLPHLLVIPWMVGRSPARPKRFFTIAMIALYAGIAIGGAAGWLWLILR